VRREGKEFGGGKFCTFIRHFAGAFRPSSFIAICRSAQLLLLPRIAEKKRRVIGDDETHPAICVHAPAQACKRLARAEQISCSGRSERHQNLRVNRVDLAKEERRAGVGSTALACGCWAHGT